MSHKTFTNARPKSANNAGWTKRHGFTPEMWGFSFNPPPPKIENPIPAVLRPELFGQGRHPPVDNGLQVKTNNVTIISYQSSNNVRDVSDGNNGEMFTSVKTVYSAKSTSQKRNSRPNSASTRSHPYSSQIPAKNVTKPNKTKAEWTPTGVDLERLGQRGALDSPFLEGIHVILPRRLEKPRPRPNTVETPENRPKFAGEHRKKNADIGQHNNKSSNDSQKTFATTNAKYSGRAQTAPAISSAKEVIEGSCLKIKDINNINNSSSKSTTRHSVTFAPDTLNIDRESKPKKLRLKNNRKPKFAHPCCGHFLPPLTEVLQYSGPDHGNCWDNPYIRYNSVWCSPKGRTSSESVAKRNVRVKRFRGLLADLSAAHERFNEIPELEKAKLMIDQIIPRYICTLEIAAMDGELDHVQQLLSTINSSIRILQINLHDIFFERNGEPKKIKPMPNDEDYANKLAPILCSINRIIGDQSLNLTSTHDLSIEAQIVKLQLELLLLSFSPVNCIIFRSQLSVIPSTANSALEILKKLRDKRSYYCVKWVNDSVMHRDYMGILKYFGYCDDLGAKHPAYFTNELKNVLSGNRQDLDENDNPIQYGNSNTRHNIRPSSAGPVLESSEERTPFNYFTLNQY